MARATLAIDHTNADAGSFEARLQAHAGIVRKVAGSYARTAADRADLMQDIVAALWQAWPRYDRQRPFSTWMYRVALNVAVSRVRVESRRNRHHVAFDADMHDVGSNGHDHEGEQSLALLDKAMDSLDAMNRALLMLHLDDRSHREIAEVLGISESNVATRLSRLKERLRKSLATS